jgi:hypothetical protein
MDRVAEMIARAGKGTYWMIDLTQGEGNKRVRKCKKKSKGSLLHRLLPRRTMRLRGSLVKAMSCALCHILYCCMRRHSRQSSKTPGRNISGSLFLMPHGQDTYFLTFAHPACLPQWVTLRQHDIK